MQKKILKTEPTADNFLVEMSAILHDVDDFKMGGDGKNVDRWLDKIKLQKDLSERILKITKNIGYGTSGENPKFEDIETKIVYDSDKLDSIGAIGIARVFAFSGSHACPIFVPNIFPEKHFDISQYKNVNRKENTAINHFFDKLLRLKNIMQTKEGKKEAIKRHEIMIKFLKDFFEEQDLKDWQNFMDDFIKNL